jgi:molybdopterin-guanine dinucleotide biosynthesis protein A
MEPDVVRDQIEKARGAAGSLEHDPERARPLAAHAQRSLADACELLLERVEALARNPQQAAEDDAGQATRAETSE